MVETLFLNLGMATITYIMMYAIIAFHKNIAKLVFATVAMQANGSTIQETKVQFDTDSEPIGIDNRCTGCISHQIEDVDGPLIDSN
jgi:hypothetical protein